MKPATLLALPVLALAAATPAKVEERQLPGLPGLPDPTRLINLDCILAIDGIASCFVIDPNNPPLTLGDLLGLINRVTCPVLAIIQIPTCLLPV